MNKRNILSIIVISVFLIAGISSVVLYKLGDRIFDEMIDIQIAEIENTIEIPKSSEPIIEQPIQADVNENTASPAISAPAEQTAKPSTSVPQTEAVQIAIEKLEDIKQEVSATDKMRAATLVMSKLSQADISQLTELATSGITSEEKEQMKDILYKRFTVNEIEEIRAMYIKYMK